LNNPNKQYICAMLLRKGNSVLASILLIWMLLYLSDHVPSTYQLKTSATLSQTIQESNLNSRIKIQFQFQALTNIYQKFDIKTETHNLIRPFQGIIRFTTPHYKTVLLTQNKEFELSSLWARNKNILHLFPFHGFS